MIYFEPRENVQIWIFLAWQFYRLFAGPHKNKIVHKFVQVAPYIHYTEFNSAPAVSGL